MSHNTVYTQKYTHTQHTTFCLLIFLRCWSWNFQRNTFITFNNSTFNWNCFLTSSIIIIINFIYIIIYIYYIIIYILYISLFCLSFLSYPQVVPYARDCSYIIIYILPTVYRLVQWLTNCLSCFEKVFEEVRIGEKKLKDCLYICCINLERYILCRLVVTEKVNNM